MRKRILVTAAGFIMVLLIIGIGGPYLSSMADKNYRDKIDRHGVIVKAVVVKKKTHKGNSVHFTYQFNKKVYKNNEQSDEVFNRLNVGDSIDVLADSTNPEASYIVR